MPRTYNGYLSIDFNSVRPQLPRYNNRSSPDALYTDTGSSKNWIRDVLFLLTLTQTPIVMMQLLLLTWIHTLWDVLLTSLASYQCRHWNHGRKSFQNQLSFDSEQVLHRNRHYPFGASGSDDDLSRAGIAVMTDGVKLWYPEPYKSDPIANFRWVNWNDIRHLEIKNSSAWAWSTQVYQADYYAHQLAFYRRGSGMRERQLGSLYWQLEDLWYFFKLDYSDAAL